MIFLEIVVGMGEVLWPWLPGRSDTGFLRPALTLVGFAMMGLSWQYVKDSNRAAAGASGEDRCARGEGVEGRCVPIPQRSGSARMP